MKKKLAQRKTEKSPRDDAYLEIRKPDSFGAINSVVGIDLSLSETGICYISPSCVDFQLIRSKKQPNRFIRIESINQCILEYVIDHQPDLIVIEGYSFNSFGRVFDLAELGGVVRKSLWELFPLVEVSPKSLKKWFTGNGNADKQMMIDKANKFGLAVDNNNLADAYALARFGLEKIRH